MTVKTVDIYYGQFKIPFWSSAWEREKMTDRLLLQYAVNTASLILNEQAIKGPWATLFSLHCPSLTLTFSLSPLDREKKRKS